MTTTPLTSFTIYNNNAISTGTTYDELPRAENDILQHALPSYLSAADVRQSEYDSRACTNVAPNSS